jgi:hypothetical protein
VQDLNTPVLSRELTLDGETHTLGEWAMLCGLKGKSLQSMASQGLDIGASIRRRMANRRRAEVTKRVESVE